jgi:hypothetical protein
MGAKHVLAGMFGSPGGFATLGWKGQGRMRFLCRQLSNSHSRQGQSRLWICWYIHESHVIQILADRLAQYVQAYTLYSSVRPIGASTLVASMDEYHGPQLYMIEPSGVFYVSFIHNSRTIAISPHRAIMDVRSAKVVKLLEQRLKSWIWPT